MSRRTESPSDPSPREQLDQLESQVRRRMQELAPLVLEYRELERIARRLGLDGLGASEASPAGEALTLPDGVRPTLHVPAGHRRRQVHALIRARPGLTVREAAAELGVDPTSLYRIVRRLVRDGEIEKRGRSLHPVD